MSPAALLLSRHLLLAAAGKPPSAEEQRLFDEGAKAMQAGDAQAADKAWRAGYAIAKDPAFLVHMGEAEEKAGQPAEGARPTDATSRCARCVGPRGDRAAAGAPRPRGSARRPRPPRRTRSRARSARARPCRCRGATSPLPPRVGARGARRRDRPPRQRRQGLGLERVQHHRLDRDRRDGDALGAAAYYAASAGSAKDDVNQFLRYRDQVTGAPLEYRVWPRATRLPCATASTISLRQGRADRRRRHRAGGDGLLHRRRRATPERHGQHESARPARSTPVFGLALHPDGGRMAGVSALRWSF